MNWKACISILFLALPTILTAQLFTTGDFSPAVIARDFNAIYGVRPDVVEEILDVYARKGLSAAERKDRTEQLIREFVAVSPESGTAAQMSVEEQSKLGIETEPNLIQAFNWQLFASKFHLSTKSAYSPAVIAYGDVKIWYGIPELALRTLAKNLEEDHVELADFEMRLGEMAGKYDALKREFEIYGPGDIVVHKAENLLEEGKLEEAEQLLENDLFHSKRHLAFMAYLSGKTKELLMKYDSASLRYKDAVKYEPMNEKYLTALANNELTLAHYDKAILTLETALGYLNGTEKGSDTLKADIFGLLGNARHAQGQYDAAIDYFQRALAIDTIIFGSHHPKVARDYRCLGESSQANGNLRKAIQYLKSAIDIDTSAIQNVAPAVVRDFNSLGAALLANDQRDAAIDCHKHALQISQTQLGTRHPMTAKSIFCLGETWVHFGDLVKGLSHFQEAILIDSSFLGGHHPRISEEWNRIGFVYLLMSDFEKATEAYGKALAIDTVLFGKIHPRVASELNYLGDIWGYQHRDDKALPYYEEALAIGKEALGEMHPDVALYMSNIAVTLTTLGRPDEALWYCAQAMKIDTAVYGQVHEMVARNYLNLCAAYRKKGEYGQALIHCEHALMIDTIVLGPENINVAIILTNIGNIYLGLKQYSKAIDYYQQSITIFRRFYDDSEHFLRWTIQNLLRASYALGKQLEKDLKTEAAIVCFQGAQSDAEQVGEQQFSVLCMTHLASMFLKSGDLGHSMALSEMGIRRADSLLQLLLQGESERQDSLQYSPFHRDFSGSAFLRPLQRRLQYIKLCCLVGLHRKKEAKSLSKLVISEAQITQDQELITNLRNDGWLKEKKNPSNAQMTIQKKEPR